MLVPQEADEAFGAIQYALAQQLQRLEDEDPEFVQTWLSNLGETRAAFMDMVCLLCLLYLHIILALGLAWCVWILHPRHFQLRAGEQSSMPGLMVEDADFGDADY